MALSDFVAPSRNIMVPGNDDIVVRGLSLTDVSHLVRDFRPELDFVFKNIDGLTVGTPMENLDLGHLISILFESAPLLAASIIARAADEPDQAKAVVRLPLAVQLEAIEAVGDLTFASEGGPKKVFEAVTRMLVGVRGLVAPSRPKVLR